MSHKDGYIRRRTFSLCVLAGAVIGAVALAVLAYFTRPK